MLLTDDGRDILGRGGGGGGECFLKLAFHSLNFPVCERLPRKTTYCRLLKRLPSPIYTSATSSSKCCWKGGTQIFSSRFAVQSWFFNLPVTIQIIHSLQKYDLFEDRPTKNMYLLQERVDIEAELECPICLELSRPPIYQVPLLQTLPRKWKWSSKWIYCCFF